jgi:hypothetical protein
MHGVRAAGVDVLGFVDSAMGVTTESAWRAVVGGSVIPHSVISDERQGYLQEVTATWRSVATMSGIIDTRGEFLLGVAGEGAFEFPWIHVRETTSLRLGEALAVDGQPEFVSVAADGAVVCGVTTEEDVVWVIKKEMNTRDPLE